MSSLTQPRDPEPKNGISRALISILLVAFCLLYSYGAVKQAVRVNTDIGSTNQSAFVKSAIQVYQSHFTDTGDRNRMPLYSFLQAIFYDPQMTMTQFWEQGKYINIGLSIAALCMFLLLFRRYFSSVYSAQLVLVTAFTVFIFKAGYFQAEILFYFLTSCAYLLMLTMLERPGWPLAILTGTTLALAHLTKASVLPGLVIFVAIALCRVFWQWRSGYRRGKPQDSRSAIVLFGNTSLVVLTFLAVLFPYLSESKARFGSYFYNVNSTFYIWYDSWDEAKEGTKAHGDREGWPDMPPEEIPSASKYLREHTWSQIQSRITAGLWSLRTDSTNEYGHMKYVLLYLVFAVLSAIAGFRGRLRNLVHDCWGPVAFIVAYFVAYVLLYAWYVPISGGGRFVLALFIPVVLSLSLIIRYFSSEPLLTLWGRIRIRWSGIVSFAACVCLLFDTYFILTERIVEIYGGR